MFFLVLSVFLFFCERRIRRRGQRQQNGEVRSRNVFKLLQKNTLADLLRVTNQGVSAVASAGCGENMTSLHLDCELGREVFFSCASRAAVCACFFPLTDWTTRTTELSNRAALDQVTDAGVCDLAAAGCGKGLKSLTLRREFLSVSLALL